MATLVLAAAGGAAGGALGSGALGLSSLAIGKAAGATLGAVIDQRVFGQGSAAVEVGQRETFRITGASEGDAMARVWGQMRVPGQIIWSSRFLESIDTTGGGKGGSSAPKTTSYSYSVSLAIALCEGEVTRLGRIWADGQIVDTSTLEMRLYTGTQDQLADPLLVASLPEGETPAYRGVAYVVIENLQLAPYGDRIPQFNFEVVRRPLAPHGDPDPIAQIQGVALVPGTGEYALATEPVSFDIAKGETKFSNVNNDAGRPDALVAIDNLANELPACRATSLIVSWFGSDLRCGECVLTPKVEQVDLDGTEMPWEVSGLVRANAGSVSYVEDRPGFGGTPADASVLQSIAALQEAGQAVMFYPFVLMDIRAGNGLPDPWGGAEQAPVPWRGRITGSAAPGQPGSPDKTATAAAQVADFFGAATAADFDVTDDAVRYTGAPDWGYRRFILHYAHLCALAGGVESFCIGSELRSLTQLRDAPGSYPAVAALIQLARDVRGILGPDVKIGYAADWSEYFGHHPADGSGDLDFHLDPLWADADIDFIGIDNYMPLSDWRDGVDHADAAAGTIYDLAYLQSNIEGGEGFDWYYASADARAAQIRTPITDGAYDTPWVYRYKDIRSWWMRVHRNRSGGVQESAPTAWVPQSKPIRFTELGCPAVDKGTNQPNVFIDPQSSENNTPYFSHGGQDRYIQYRYLAAMLDHWGEAENNPTSHLYGAPMVDMAHAYVWAWDARPWPEFPRRLDVWSDGENHARGHWISGRAHFVPLADVVRDICLRAGVSDVDTSALYGMVQGYSVEAVETARQSLQPLMLAYGFDAQEIDGKLVFRNRRDQQVVPLDVDALALEAADAPAYELTRQPNAELPDRARIAFIHPEQDYQGVTAEAVLPGRDAIFAAGSSLGVALSHAEGDAVAARWLAEARVGRDGISLSVPRSMTDLALGGHFSLELDGVTTVYRADRIEEQAARTIQGTRVDPEIYRNGPVLPELVSGLGVVRAGAPYVSFLDLPLIAGTETDHAPHLAVTQVPWGGEMAAFAAPEDHAFALVAELPRGAVVGTTLTALGAAAPDRWSGQTVDVRVSGGVLASRSRMDVLNGANLAGLRAEGADQWEIIQFATAELVADNLYRLGDLLRGQYGTEALIPEVLAAGADLVLLDGSAVQTDLPLAAVGLTRIYRVGPAGRAYDDPSYSQIEATPMATGQRPYAPAHLGAARETGGDIAIHWVRRTRFGGDGWHLADVPLNEASERYQVEISDAGGVLRTLETTAPEALYSATQQAADGGTGPLTLRVAQVSDRFGPGHYARITFNG